MLDIEKRFRRYENTTRNFLTIRTPVIIRVDGNAFHTLTKSYGWKHYDDKFTSLMVRTAKDAMSHIAGVRFAYVQSDEISFLLTDYEKLDTQPWFEYNINKLVSISAAVVTAYFNNNNTYKRIPTDKIGWFDSRAFNVPKEDVNNYFVWRQKDAIRNSMSILAREHFSHRQLQSKNFMDMGKMLYDNGISWYDLPPHRIYGLAVYKKDMNIGTIPKRLEWYIDSDIREFDKDRNFVEQWL